MTTGTNPSITAAITTIADHTWVPIRYPNAIEDPDAGESISDAEVAEMPCHTAFTGRRRTEQVPPG